MANKTFGDFVDDAPVNVAPTTDDKLALVHNGNTYSISPTQLIGVAAWTLGSIPFATSTTALGQDPANLFWDDTNNRLGVGTASPTTALDVGGALGIGITNASPTLYLTETDQTLDNKIWRYTSAAGVTYLQSMDDAKTAAQIAYAFTRTGTNVTSAMLFTNNLDRLHIDVNGNVGINTSVPAAKLHSQVASSGTLGLFIGNTTYSATALYGLGMQVNDTGTAIIRGGWSSAKDILLNDAGGNVGIGVAVAGKRLTVAGQSATGGVTTEVRSGPNGADSTTTLMVFADFAGAVGIGSISRTGSNSVAYNTTSDARLKDDIIESQRGLDALMAIKVSDYRMGETQQQGLLAQDIYEVYPEAVHKGGDDPDMEPWMIDYGRLTPLLIRGLQHMKEEIEALKARLPDE